MNNKIPPPIIGLATGYLMWLIADHLQWAHYSFSSQLWLSQTGVFYFLALLGGGMALTGIVTFKLAKTTTNPMSLDKASELVTHGIYTMTRNPMYLGVLIVLMGWSIHLGSLLSITALPLYVWYITQFQIIPEEFALETIFGQSFVKYQNNVRRWV